MLRINVKLYLKYYGFGSVWYSLKTENILLRIVFKV